MREKQTILIVDDDDSIRQVLCELLRFSGYEVISCSDADAAISVLDRKGGSIGTIIADYVLPGTNGLALAREARRIAPWARTVIISGHRHVRAECRRGAGVRFLAKPFGTADVLRTLEDLDVPQRFGPRPVQSVRPALGIAM